MSELVRVVLQWRQLSDPEEGDFRRWTPLPGNYYWRHSRLRRFNGYCSELCSVRISERATITCIYDLSLSLWQNSLSDIGRFFRFFYLFTLDRILWTEGQPVARPIITHGKHKYRIKVHRHQCLEWDPNPQPQWSREGIQFIYKYILSYCQYWERN
jgi:hypothetical protein